MAIELSAELVTGTRASGAPSDLRRALGLVETDRRDGRISAKIGRSASGGLGGLDA